MLKISDTLSATALFGEFSGQIEWVQCALCGSAQYVVLYPSTFRTSDFGADRAKSFMYASPDRSRGNIVGCSQCGLVYMNPRDKDIGKLYEGVGDDPYYVSSETDRKATNRRDLEQLEKITGPANGRTLLDVGCSYGFFLDESAARGWEVSGCELSRVQAAEALRRHSRVYTQELSRCPFPENYFDVITLFDVIEHIPLPGVFISQIKRVLKPGGLVAIETPNVASMPARLAGKYWLNYIRMHLYYFSPRTISQLLVREGFEIAKITKHYRIIKLGVAIGWLQKYPLLYKFLKIFLGNRLVRNITWRSGLSGNMTVYARKPIAS